MTCRESRARLAALHAGGPPALPDPDLQAHLSGCAGCAAEDREERDLSGLLAALPDAPAPAHLRQALERRVSRAEAGAVRHEGVAPAGWRRAYPALAGATAVAAAVTLWFSLPGTAPAGLAPLAEEAVNDHLRALVAPRPDVESGGVHQVRPWFEGRLDFAPPVPDLEAAGLRLRGGSVGYFGERRAAVLQYQLRLHQVTLLVFRADGLPLPERPGSAQVRGFRALLWREGPLGFALVSDAEAGELRSVAALVRP